MRAHLIARAALLLLALAPFAASPACDDYDAPIDGLGPCADTLPFFEERIWGAVMAEGCTSCHRDGGLAGHTRLVLRPPAAGDAWLAHNLRVASRLAAEQIDGLPLLLAKPSGQHPGGHTGGLLVPRGTAAYGDLAAFAARVSGDCSPAPADLCGEDDGSLGRRLLRRLSHDEHRRTVTDLLGLAPADLDGASPFAPDESVEGFANNADALRVSSLLADHYREAAEALARLAVATRLDALLPCPTATADRACVVDFIAAFGLRAFRRPLTADDVARYLAVYDLAASDGLAAGVEWVVAALLQSPHFLYRAELGVRGDDDAFTLTPYEVASALSYLYWGTMPDDALFAAAASGALATAQGRATQIARLAADPRADVVVADFTRRWLGLDLLPVVARDAVTYPDLRPAVRAAMAAETDRLATRLFRDDATLAELIAADHTWLTADLAAYYGLTLDPAADADADGFVRVDLADTPRAGLLTQGSVLVTHALPSSSSPIHRGKLVRERLLCHPLEPPPPGIFASPPEPNPALTTRERYQEHASVEGCAGCHRLTDPIGFGLEHFDGDGRYRERDGVHPIDASGRVVDLDGGDVAFEGAAGLAEALAQSGAAGRCYVTQWVRYGYGVEADLCGLDALVDTFEASGARLAAGRELLATAPRFLRRRGGPDELDTLAVGADADPVDPPDRPDPPEPPTPGEITVSAHETTRWDGGYCMQVDLRNPGAEPVSWQVELPVAGGITSLWSARATPLSADRARFVGEDYNATLRPEGTTTFGWCAQL